jgi:GTP cyclohydrolase IA
MSPIFAGERPGRVSQPAVTVEAAYGALILAAEGTQADRAGLSDTPKRAARAWAEMMAGYGSELDLRTFDAEGCDQIVAIKDVPFFSTCEHHGLSFFGTVDFAYIPNSLILGLSKFARLAEHFGRRLQVQERLTHQMANALEDALAPQGAMVVVRAQHLCMMVRGVQKLGAQTITSAVTGAFLDNPQTRAEGMELLR